MVKKPILHHREGEGRRRKERGGEGRGEGPASLTQIPGSASDFNGLSPIGGQYVSPCQISPKAVNWLRRYGDLAVFKMAAVCHGGFLKFKFLTVWTVKRPTLHHRAKFPEDRSIRF